MNLEKYPFRAGLRCWTSEDLYKESGQLWPAIDEEEEVFREKILAWILHLITYSVQNPDVSSFSEELLSIGNYQPDKGQRWIMKAECIDFAREVLNEELVAELPPLQEEHRKEISPFTHLVKDVDWKTYYQIQSAGMLYFFSAREKISGKLVGYANFIAHRHLHYNLISASCDALFLLPEYRRGRVGIELISYSEIELKKAGVEMVFHSSTSQRDLSKLFRRMGYKPEGVLMARVLQPMQQ